MKVTLKINAEMADEIRESILDWEDDSMIHVWEDSKLNLNNSGNNLCSLDQENLTVSYEGRRHGLESPTMTSIFCGANYEIKEELKKAPVIKYDSWRTDRPWWEFGLDSPAVKKVKETCREIGKSLPQNGRLIEMQGKIWIEDFNDLDLSPFKFSALDYRRAGTMGIKI